MEVIVDDTQLSLAIGKKGQNVRLAAKLLGWKIDIKSEEEKRQEVESQMAALVVPGAPVSVLIDHGLPEKIVEKLLEGGIATVEKLGNMTPEELEEVPGIGPKLVEKIQDAVVSYYGQYEEAMEAPAENEPVADQEPTLEIGSEASEVAEADSHHDESEEEFAAPAEDTEPAEEEDLVPADGDRDESVRIKDAE
jgi:N utilization substance protein A